MSRDMYYIHQPSDWGGQDLKKINLRFEELKIHPSLKAAIGEGGGGSGFESVIEVLIGQPVISSIVASILWDISKVLWNHRPKKKENLPAQIRMVYKLLVHTNDHHIIGINMLDDISDIKIAIDKLPEITKSKSFSRAYQNGKHWDVF